MEKLHLELLQKNSKLFSILDLPTCGCHPPNVHGQILLAVSRFISCTYQYDGYN